MKSSGRDTKQYTVHQYSCHKNVLEKDPSYIRLLMSVLYMYFIECADTVLHDYIKKRAIFPSNLILLSSCDGSKPTGDLVMGGMVGVARDTASISPSSELPSNNKASRPRPCGASVKSPMRLS